MNIASNHAEMLTLLCFVAMINCVSKREEVYG